jgi:hypothetical protein
VASPTTDTPLPPRALRPATIRFAGNLLASALSGALMASLGLILGFYYFAEDRPQRVNLITSRPFEGPLGRPNPINASGLVPIADARFLVVDDETGDAFYEMELNAEGGKVRPLTRQAIAGLLPEAVEDLEDATLVEEGSERVIVAVSSLERHEGEETADGLVRVVIGAEGGLAGEIMPGFRSWLLTAYPELGVAPGGPDVLDIQGLIWSPEHHTLLFGVRSATRSGRPLILPVRVTTWNGPWTTDILEPMSAIEIGVGSAESPRGIRGIARHPVTGQYALIIGDAGSTHEPFALYVWDGSAEGAVRQLPDFVFGPDMKPEGITYGRIEGRLATVIVDDNGGYYVLWEEASITERLAPESALLPESSRRIARPCGLSSTIARLAGRSACTQTGA